MNSLWQTPLERQIARSRRVLIDGRAHADAVLFGGLKSRGRYNFKMLRQVSQTARLVT